jgi:hypothetical protein
VAECGFVETCSFLDFLLAVVVISRREAKNSRLRVFVLRGKRKCIRFCVLRKL